MQHPTPDGPKDSVRPDAMGTNGAFGLPFVVDDWFGKPSDHTDVADRVGQALDRAREKSTGRPDQPSVSPLAGLGPDPSAAIATQPTPAPIDAPAATAAPVSTGAPAATGTSAGKDAPDRLAVDVPTSRATTDARPGKATPDHRPAAPFAPIRLSDLQRQLLDVITSHDNEEKTLSQVMHLLLRGAATEALVLMRRNDPGQLVAGPRLHRRWLTLTEPMLAKLTDCGQQACHENRVQTHPLDDPGQLTAVALPIAIPGSHANALCAVLRTTEFLNYSVAILHLGSAYLSLWHVRNQAVQTDWEADNAAALVEMISRLQLCDQVHEACHQLVKDMQQYVACQRIAIGLCRREGACCRLQAISGSPEFDRRADLARLMEATMQEAIVRDEMTVWPAGKSRRPATLAHKKLARTADVETLVSVPLKDVHGVVVGAWLFLGDQRLAGDTQRHHMIRATSPHVGSCLQLVQRNQRGRLSRWAEAVWVKRRGWQGPSLLAAIVVFCLILLIPLPYRIACDARLQPVTRRFVAAPFPGTLQRTVCEPGQVVAQGELLAQLDGREIRWELAGLVAEHQRADKERQVAMATHDTAMAQQTELRKQRLALRIRLLEHHSENLEIRSPIDGVVVRGDLEDAVGVPVTSGQTLFEVAPLGKMVAEIAIPDEEIHYTRKNSPVTLRLDAEPGREWKLTLAHVHPVAEVVDGKNIFVGAVPLDNPDNQLRPGMAGRATVSGPRRPLVWNLFHKPWYYLLGLFGV